MSRRRRAVVLGALALLLGGLAASDVGGREAALRRQVGPLVPVVVVRVALPEGARLTPERLAVRRVPGRWAPRRAFPAPDAVVGLRTAVALPAGTDLAPALLDDGREEAGAPVGPGERVADVIAVGSPALVRPGTRVDVLVTREDGNGRPGRAELALEAAEVLTVRPAPEARGSDGAPRVAVALRVSVRQAVFLGAAQAFAREIRLLPRAAGDDRRGAAGTSVGQSLAGGGRR